MTSLSALFYNSSFNGDISNWDISTITNMNQMFRRARSFDGDLSSWDVSHVTNMNAMFYQANTNYNPDVTNWDISSATDVRAMFREMYLFNQDLSNWDISSIADGGKGSQVYYGTGVTACNVSRTLKSWALQAYEHNLKYVNYMGGSSHASHGKNPGGYYRDYIGVEFDTLENDYDWYWGGMGSPLNNINIQSVSIDTSGSDPKAIVTFSGPAYAKGTTVLGHRNVIYDWGGELETSDFEITMVSNSNTATLNSLNQKLLKKLPK